MSRRQMSLGRLLGLVGADREDPRASESRTSAPVPTPSLETPDLTRHSPPAAHRRPRRLADPARGGHQGRPPPAPPHRAVRPVRARGVARHPGPQPRHNDQGHPGRQGVRRRAEPRLRRLLPARVHPLVQAPGPPRVMGRRPAQCAGRGLRGHCQGDVSPPLDNRAHQNQ